MNTDDLATWLEGEKPMIDCKSTWMKPVLEEMNFSNTRSGYDVNPTEATTAAGPAS